MRSDPGMVAINLVLLTKVVARALPFHRTCEPGTKPLPLTVSWKLVVSTQTAVGETLEMYGVGLLMVKVRGLDAPPQDDGLETVMLAVPAVAMSEAGMEAYRYVLPPTVVDRGLPFHRTCAPGTKFVPYTTRVKAWPPAVVELG